jgi:hypothetical protein
MHFNNQFARDHLLMHMPDYFDNAISKVLAFVNLCIYPHKFEVVYDSIKNHSRISNLVFDCLKGTIRALLVITHRHHAECNRSIDEYVVDFVEFIKNDKSNDPIKFLLTMRFYMPRYQFAKGLKVAFGIDWRVLVTELLGLEKPPNPQTYHSLCTNNYLRNLLRTYVVYKNYKDTHEDGYKQGENDVVTLLRQTYAYSTALPSEQLDALFFGLCSNLPSWSYDVRRKAAYAIDTAQDGYYIINRPYPTPEPVLETIG